MGLSPALRSDTYAMAAGDRLLVYTLGLLDARDGDGNFFTLRERAQILSGCRGVVTGWGSVRRDGHRPSGADRKLNLRPATLGRRRGRSVYSLMPMYLSCRSGRCRKSSADSVCITSPLLSR